MTGIQRIELPEIHLTAKQSNDVEFMTKVLATLSNCLDQLRAYGVEIEGNPQWHDTA